MANFNLRNLKTISIIYVEDERVLREQSTKIYSKLFEHVYPAKDGEEALELLKNVDLSIDVIVTDINMPKMSGLQLAKKIKEFSQVPVIITSAYSDIEYFLEAIELGIKKFIVKPTTINTIINDIEKTVTQYRKELKIRQITKTLIVETKENSKKLTTLKKETMDYSNQIDFYKNLSNDFIPMLRTDKNGIITKVSKKLLCCFGFNKEELIGVSISTFKDKTCDNVSIQKQMLEAIRNKDTIKSTHIFKRKNKNSIKVNVTMSLFLNKEDYVDGYNFYLEAILD